MYPGPLTEGIGQQLWMKRRDSFEATPIAGTVGATMFAISPDGASVTFVVGQQLKTVSLSGGAPITLIGDGLAQGLGVAWMDDGTIVYPTGGIGGYTLWGVPAAGGTAKPITHPDSSASIL